MMKFIHTLILPALLLLAPFALSAQLKSIEMEDVHRWKSIDKQLITPDGQWVAYLVKPVSEGDAMVRLWNATNEKTVEFPRSESPAFSEDGQWLTFTIKPALDSLRAMKRKKLKGDDLPKDTLGIYHLPTGKLEKIARVKGYTLPEYWSGWLLIHLEPALKIKEKPLPKDSVLSDSLKAIVEKKAKAKKENADNGSLLLVRNLNTGATDTFPFVSEYSTAKRAPALLFSTTGIGDAPQWQTRKEVALAGVYARQLAKKDVEPLWRGKAKFKQLALDESGKKAAFLLDADTTKAFIRPWQVVYRDFSKKDSSQVIADNSSAFLPDQPANVVRSGKWIIGENSRPVFNKAGDRLFFGIVPPGIVPDSTALPEEVAKVEVWATSSPNLHTALKERLKEDLKRTWPVVCLLDQKMKMITLADPAHPELRMAFDRDRNGEYALGIDEEPGMQASQWLGAAGKDLYAVSLKNGEKRLLQRNALGSASLSPEAGHILWWSVPDSSWWAQPIAGNAPVRLTNNTRVPFFDETEDVPDLPSPHGIAGWLTGEKGILVYDQYDIWLCAPEAAPRRLTNGRATQTTYRYIRLDPEVLTIDPKGVILLHGFNKITKRESYALLNLANGTQKNWMEGAYSLTRSPLKAKSAPALVYTHQDFATFPDLQWTTLPEFSKVENTQMGTKRISDVNPQQKEYAWPTIELVQWFSITGDTLSGLLVKPADFNPAKQYPMIVYFYEKLSDGLYQHRAPAFQRSSIVPTQYASRGYVIFIPDIPYRIGYPGESAYNAVVSGTTAMIQRGGIDPKRVALQGHSWGGYQAAWIVTRTNMFRCAEAGAAVVNMTSAYGGIRWETGVNRNFQYEHQQSRIGGTLWEKPLLYLENSPLFSLDKVETPLLLMHNDKDGAVPWEQGIEYFTGLRRLGKPAWLLNYNDEPHWPVKLPNRIDFQTRMQQFFDYYLLNAPQPKWMEKGIPPMERELKGW